MACSGTYEARLWKGDDAWYAEVPAYLALFAEGDTVGEACENAAGFLQLLIADDIDEGRPLSSAKFTDNPGLVLCVEVNADFIEASKCVTFAEAAEALGVTRGRVSQLVANGQLDVVEHGGKRLVTIASVENRRKKDEGLGHGWNVVP